MVVLGPRENSLSELLLGKGMEGNRYKNEVETDGRLVLQAGKKHHEKELARGKHYKIFFAHIQATYMNKK